MLSTIEIYHDLRETMYDVAAEKIAEHLGRMYDELRTIVKREDFSELKEVVKDLAESQRELADAQKRTELEIKDLVVAHKDLEKAHSRLAQQVGGLSDTIGGDIEDIAYSLVFRVLSDKFGWQIGNLERVWHTWDNKTEEVNIFGQAVDPNHPDQTIWIVGEAKHNLTMKELNKFLKQVERARLNLQGDIFPLCFCYRARPEVQQKIRDNGIFLLFSYGKLLAPAEKRH